MSFDRLKYDSCAYRHQLNESIGPGEYQLDTNNMCEPCFMVSPSVNVGRFGAALCDRNLIDVDSEMIGITRRASLCPSQKYLPQAEPFCKTKPLKDCNGLDSEPTKLSNPPCTLRSRGWNRFEPWLCKNPQDLVEVPFDWNINNRLVVKDSHRPCLPKPLDPTLALPSEREQHKDLYCGIPQDVHPHSYASCEKLRQF